MFCAPILLARTRFCPCVLCLRARPDGNADGIAGDLRTGNPGSYDLRHKRAARFHAGADADDHAWQLDADAAWQRLSRGYTTDEPARGGQAVFDELGDAHGATRVGPWPAHTAHHAEP